jgi:X-X-X-Leu-X-X-Gly heptad repeat protein
MFRRLLLCVVIAAPALLFAQKQQLQELQRDVGLLQQQVKDLKEAQDKQLAALTVLVQQAVDGSNRASTGVAVIQSGLQQSLRDMEGKVVAPVVGLSTRFDQVAGDLRTLQQAVADLASLMAKIQTQLSDLNTAVKVLQAPPPSPPAQAASAAAPDMPAISATDLFANSERDRTTGKLDLALQEYSDYLKWYGSTDQAPSAQFYIGYIHYGQGDYENAVKDFDLVVERYADNIRTPQALYYKGMSLTKIPGHKTEGSEEFIELIKRFPSSDLSRQACDQLKSLGKNCPARAAATPAKGAGKKKK